MKLLLRLTCGLFALFIQQLTTLQLTQRCTGLLVIAEPLVHTFVQQFTRFQLTAHCVVPLQ